MGLRVGKVENGCRRPRAEGGEGKKSEVGDLRSRGETGKGKRPEAGCRRSEAGSRRSAVGSIFVNKSSLTNRLVLRNPVGVGAGLAHMQEVIMLTKKGDVYHGR